MRRMGALLAVGVLAALGGGLAWALRIRSQPPRVLLTVEAEGCPPEGLRLLVSDVLETCGGWVPLDASGTLPPRAHRLELKARRQNGALALQARLDGRPLDLPEGPPDQVLEALDLDLGLLPPGPNLVPRDPARFWELVELAGGSADAPRPDLEARAEALCKALPGCASARLVWGFYATRILVESRPISLEAQQRCEQNLREGLKACPGHPRLASMLAIYLTDTGRQREALETSLDSLRIHPRAPALLNSVAYAARTSGLLRLADRALEREAECMGQSRIHFGLADNTRLYQGDLDGFEAGLPQVGPGRIRVFYQGYARLLRQDPAGALAAFRRADGSRGGSLLFVRLAGVYRRALEEGPQPALQDLDALAAERVEVSEPDGELTFKIAEAYGYLGQPRRAFEFMEKATLQGFVCTSWYERSPFLAEARKLPAWPSLRQTLQQRQALMELRFPPRILPG